MAVNPVEVNDFKFRQLRKLSIFSENEVATERKINLLASSSRFGILFVGIANGFKVLKLDHILDLDEDKTQQRNYAENYACQIVHSATPILLSLSADDMTLSVCVILSDMRIMADMYDIRAFADPGATPVPFMNVLLSSNNECLKDFMWNPVVVEMYAFCLGDGSIHVHEINNTKLKIVGNLATEIGGTCVCWSPKGKQIVIGKKDGSFSQYKPTLQEVKKIPPPPNVHEVVNIHWISTSLFSVVYLNSDKLPNLVFVSTPKGVPISYADYGDICFGSNEGVPKYLMHHESEWNVLICSSFGSVEAAVVGCIGSDTQSGWLHWILDDSSRAELPLSNEKETSPLGMAINHCSQRRIIISESEEYPPMPLIFLLSSSGVLCPFHILNTLPNAANVVAPSEPIRRDGERKRKDPLPASTNAPKTHPTIISFCTSTPAKTTNVQFQQNASVNNSRVKTSSNGFTFQMPSATPGPFGQMKQNMPVNSTPVSTVPKPVQPTFTPITSQNVANEMPAFQTFANMQKTVVKPSAVSSMAQASPISFTSMPSTNKLNQGTVHKSPAPNLTYSSPQPASQLVDNSPENKTGKVGQDDVYLSAMVDEISSFKKELQDLKQRALTARQIKIGKKDDITYLKQNIFALDGFQKEIIEIMQSLNSDIQALKSSSLESFSMIGDANSKILSRSDPNYVSMLRNRDLDPICAKQMQKIMQLYQYLCIQMQEVHDKLDIECSNLLEKTKQTKRNALTLPNTDAIYKTVVNNNNLIHLQQINVEQIAKSLNQMNVKNSSRIRHYTQFIERNVQDSLGKLADVLISKESQDVELNKPPTATKVFPKISSKVQSALREALLNKPVTCVRPSMIFQPCQYRLKSNSLSDKEQNTTKAKDTSISQEKALPSQTISLFETPVSVSSSELIGVNKVTQATRQATSTAHKIENLQPFAPKTDKTVTFAPSTVQNVRPGVSFQNEDVVPDDNVIKPVVGRTLTSLSGALYEDISPSDSPLPQMSSGENNVFTFEPVVALPHMPKMFPPVTSAAVRESQPSTETIVIPKASEVQPFSSTFSFSNEFDVKSGTKEKSIFSLTTPRPNPLFPVIDEGAFQQSSNPEISSVKTFSSQKGDDEGTDAVERTVAKINFSLQSDTADPSSQTQAFATSLPLFTFKETPISFQFTDHSVDTLTVGSTQEAKENEAIQQEATITSPFSNFTASSTTEDISVSETQQSVFGQKTGTPSTTADQKITTSSFFGQSNWSPPSVFGKILVDANQSNAAATTVSVSGTSSAFNPTSASLVTATVADATSQSSAATSIAPPIIYSISAIPAVTTTTTTITTAVTAATTASSGFFVQAPSTASTSPFTQTVSVAPTSPFQQTATAVVSGPVSPFGSPPVASPTSSFGVAVDTKAPFGAQTPPASPFGQTQSIPFAQTAGTQFNQNAASPSSPFGQTTSSFFSGGSTSVFGNQSSGFSFNNKPAFGQNSTGSFGLTKAVFGQSPPAASSVFGQQPESSLFGQSNLFGGLGGKPSEQNASKNAFGSVVAQTSGTSSNLFGGQGASSFGSKGGSFSGGSFTTGGGSVAQSGFGAFQQSPQKPVSGFGAAPSFGSSPSFGGVPSFGSTPTFGSSPIAATSPFSSTQPTSPFGGNQPSSFSGFAAADVPTFGTLASQSPGFSGMQQQPAQGFVQQQQQQPAVQSSFFPSGSVFGSSSNNAPSFGQSSSFGSPQSTGSGGSAFSQWRS